MSSVTSPINHHSFPCSFNTSCLAVFQHAKHILTSGTLSHLAFCLASLRSVLKYHIIRKFDQNLPSVQFSRSVMSNSLQPHGLQHARPPYLSPTPGVYPNSCWMRCHPTISSSVIPILLPPSIFPSIRVFSNDLVFRIRWTKYWSFSFNISPSNKHSGLISFRMDWLDLLAVQGTLKSLLQHYSSKASVLGRLAFLIVQLAHPYMTTGKTIALTRHTFIGKVMSLPFNMLSRLVITFLPRNTCLLISWLQPPSAVILEPKK